MCCEGNNGVLGKVVAVKVFGGAQILYILKDRTGDTGDMGYGMRERGRI